MKRSMVFSCEECGKEFDCEEEAQKHEDKCLPLEVGQNVHFSFGRGLISLDGCITSLKRREGEQVVELALDTEITDVLNLLHDGKHIWVDRINILAII